MKLTNNELEIIAKYVPNEQIDIYLNYQKIVDFVCLKCEISEEKLFCKTTKRNLTDARMLLTVLTFKIFDPYNFESNVIKDISTPLNRYINELIYKSIHKDRTIPRFYLGLFKKQIYTKEISLKDIEAYEVILLNSFKYVD